MNDTKSEQPAGTFRMGITPAAARAGFHTSTLKMFARMPYVAPVGMTRRGPFRRSCNSGSGVDAANTWNFTAAATCVSEVAVVPALGDYSSDHVDNCTNGNVISPK
ncbi:hypothetical protein [Streptomyces phaeochromogenes]|uniref:hypothetical protein n=1 Tax=Streptomyces phaeochromogenes TaxID=1923 RepID=UPI00371FC151